MKARILLAVMLFLLSATIVSAKDINPKNVTSLKAEVIQSGSISSKNVEDVHLQLYVPQNYGNIEVNMENWNVSYDEFGNRIVNLYWDEIDGKVNYRINTVINQKSRLFGKTEIKENEKWTLEAGGIDFINWVLEKSHYFDDDIKDVAKMVEFVHDFIRYDFSVTGKGYNVSTIIEKRKGVCVEYATLLLSLLRAKRIPARYVGGYSYSKKQNKFIGHAWVEVYTEEGWYPLDPTWLEMGFIDATHIRTGSFLENEQTGYIEYKGDNLNWERNKVEVDVLDIGTDNINSISLIANKSKQTRFGYVKANVESKCNFVDISINSCVDSEGEKLLDFYNDKERFFNCGKRDVYFFFYARERNYVCPISVYDQTGNVESVEIDVKNKKEEGNVFIEGMENIPVGNKLVLKARVDENFIFYSPEFGVHKNKIWELTMNRTGNYSFFLYSNNGFYKKNVRVIEKEGVYLSVTHPMEVMENNVFELNVTITNMLDAENMVFLMLFLGTKRFEDKIGLEPGEERTLRFSINAIEPEKGVIRVVANDASYTSRINVKRKKEPVNDVLSIVAHFIKQGLDFFSALIGMILAY